MKRKLTDFFPTSRFSYFILGFLVAERIYSIFFDFSFLLFCSIGLFVLTLFYRNLYKKFFSLGFLFSFVYLLSISNFQEKLTFEDYQALKIKQSLTIIPQKNLYKNYWLYQFSSPTLEKVFVVKLKSKNIEQIHHLICDQNQINIHHQQANSFFTFLSDYYYTYLEIDEKQCKKIGKTEIIKNKIKNYTEGLFKKTKQSRIVKNLSMGLIFGDNSYLDYHFKEQAKKGGILHLFAASGLHLGIIFSVQIYILRWLRFHFYIIYLFPLILTFAYIWLLDFPVSLLRAYSFIFVFCLKAVFYRNLNLLDLILYSIFMLFFLSKATFFSISFLLSYSAVLGIFYFTKILNNVYDSKKFVFLKQILIVSIAASLGTLPVVVLYFQAFSFGSILNNIILVPLTSFTLPFIYFSVILQILKIPFLSTVIWSNVDFLLKFNVFLTEILTKKVGFYKEFNEQYASYFLILYCIFLFFVFGFYFFFYKRASSNKKNSTFLQILFFLFIVLFFVLTYRFVKNKSIGEKFILKSDKNTFLYKNQSQIFIKGTCKYSYSLLSKLFIKKKICAESYQEVYFENEYCLQYLMRCPKKSYEKSIFWVTSQKILEWDQFYPKIRFRLRKKIQKITVSKNLSFIFYSPIQDSFNHLLFLHQKGNGFIFIRFPKFSKDSVDDWNELREDIGITRKWEFILLEQFNHFYQKKKKNYSLYPSVQF